MFSEAEKTDIARALVALRAGDAGPWRALAPLARLAGTADISIDLTTEATVGVPVIIARPRPAAPAVAALTARQREVLALIAEGLPNKLIARRLAISLGTAKDHVHAILTATGARNRADLVRLVHTGSLSGA